MPRRRQPRSRLGVLVHSFDGYKRFWQPAAYFAERNLPTDLPAYFASERLPFEAPSWRPITTGTGAFGDRMLRAVKAMRREGFDFVLYLQEDMWVIEPVDADEMAELVAVMDAYRIDALKLAVQWDPPPEVDDLGRHCGPVGEGSAAKFRWFGAHPYVFSHHPTVFRVDFLLEALYVSSLFRRVRPIQQEQFCSAYLKNRTVALSGDGGRYRIAMFADEPVIRYVHASTMGRLTEEAHLLLRDRGLESLYDESLEGEVFPDRRSAM